jgi:hypothetical protein
MQLQPQFIEILTWNGLSFLAFESVASRVADSFNTDFGESHYIGPLRDDKEARPARPSG